MTEQELLIIGILVVGFIAGFFSGVILSALVNSWPKN